MPDNTTFITAFLIAVFFVLGGCSFEHPMEKRNREAILNCDSYDRDRSFDPLCEP